MASLKIKTHKNFIPTLVMIIGLWGLIAIILLFVDPNTPGALVILLTILSLALLLSLSLVFRNTRRGGIIASSIIIYLSLAANNQGNILNMLLIAGSALAFEIYFSTRS